jgi:hypothetical protein
MSCIICYNKDGVNYICNISNCKYNVCNDCYIIWNNKYCIICRKKKLNIGYETHFNTIISDMIEEYTIFRINNVFNYVFNDIQNDVFLCFMNLILIPLLITLNIYIILILLCKYICVISYLYIINTLFIKIHLFITTNNIFLFLHDIIKHLCIISFYHITNIINFVTNIRI